MRKTEDIGFDGIERPPKLYLDTSHLIHIANMRKGKKLPAGQPEECYRRLDDYIRSYCGLIFNPVATMDWVGGRATQESISEIAAVVDAANLKYIALDANFFVYTREILDQCRKQDTNIITPNLPPVLQNISDNNTIRSPIGILANQVQDYFNAEPNERIQKNGGLPPNRRAGLYSSRMGKRYLRAKKDQPSRFPEANRAFQSCFV